MSERLYPSVSSGSDPSQKSAQAVTEANVRGTTALALCQSEEFNQQILDSSDDCIKVLDLEGRLLFMSRAGQMLLGINDVTPFLNTFWTEGSPKEVRMHCSGE